MQRNRKQNGKKDGLTFTNGQKQLEQKSVILWAAFFGVATSCILFFSCGCIFNTRFLDDNHNPETKEAIEMCNE